VTPAVPSGKTKRWDERIRPLPANARLYSAPAAAVADRSWDWILTHNVNDLLDCRGISLPKVFLVHGTLSGRILQDRSSVDRESYLENLRTILRAERCEIVYISKLKRDDWGLPGRIIRPGIDPGQYGGYRGDRRGILQVCNNLRGRAALLGWEAHRDVCSGLPSLVMGANRGLRESRVADGWDDLKEQYRTYRVYLNTLIHPYEDGYNLAMLEAMAIGMPVATMANPTSPIRHGLDGVIGETAAELREHVIRLLDDAGESVRLGAAARSKVAQEFPIEAFKSAWAGLASALV
jgi:hypothetical protein